MLDLNALQPQVEEMAWYIAAKQRPIVINLNPVRVTESALSILLDEPVALAQFSVELDPNLPSRPQIVARLNQVSDYLRDLSAHFIILPSDPLAAFIIGQAVGASQQSVGLIYFKSDGSLRLVE